MCGYWKGAAAAGGPGGVAARPAVAVCIQVTSEEFCRVATCACVCLCASCLCACKRLLVQFAASFLKKDRQRLRQDVGFS